MEGMKTGKLYTVLENSGYPSIEDLIFSIIDKLAEDLGVISDNARSHEYSLENIADQIDEIMEMIKRN